MSVSGTTPSSASVSLESVQIEGVWYGGHWCTPDCDYIHTSAEEDRDSGVRPDGTIAMPACVACEYSMGSDAQRVYVVIRIHEDSNMIASTDAIMKRISFSRVKVRRLLRELTKHDWITGSYVGWATIR